MGMTSNQLSMLRYVAENNLEKAKHAALACCAEDTTKKNEYAIKRYKNLLQNKGLNMLELPPNIGNFATMEDLSLTFLESRYFLSEREEKLYETIRDMNEVSLELMERHIPYLNATLLYGESGVGKTEFSKYVAYKLNLPYLYVNFSRMLNSYLGGTAKNLGLLFQFIHQQKCVVMLDEIDSLATKRQYADSSAGAEVSRSTTCLLQLLDSVTNDHIILAATNLPKSVDPAVMRRFAQQHEMLALTDKESKNFIIQYLTDAGFAYDEHSIDDYLCDGGETLQAKLLSHMTQCIATCLLKKQDKVILWKKDCKRKE